MTKKRAIILGMVFCIVLAVLYVVTDKNIVGENSLFAENTKTSNIKISKNYNKTAEWNLILVNSDHKVPKDEDIDLTTLSNNQRVDSRIYPSLQKMFDDMRAAGFKPTVASGYRTNSEQQKMLDNKIEAYQHNGYSESEAKKLARYYVNEPGTSEHETGLGVDINELGNDATSQEFYDWLYNNAYKYGFILRYPEGKESITGTSYEPWHYRYVGSTAAKKIHSEKITLEEYISWES